MSQSCDDLILEVFHKGVFDVFPLKYACIDMIELKLSRSKRLSYSQMCDLLLEKIKRDVWAWFYCMPKRSLEEGLTIVECDMDVKKMYEMAEVHGILEVYVSHIPQAYLVDFYHKNLCRDESNEEVKQKVRIHVERKKKYDSMSLEEVTAWEEEESKSPAYLRSPYVKPFKEASLFVPRMLYDDFQTAADDEGSSALPYVSKNLISSEQADDEGSSAHPCVSE